MIEAFSSPRCSSRPAWYLHCSIESSAINSVALYLTQSSLSLQCGILLLHDLQLNFELSGVCESNFVLEAHTPQLLPTMLKFHLTVTQSTLHAFNPLALGHHLCIPLGHSSFLRSRLCR
jgi:hypothetical protein